MHEHLEYRNTAHVHVLYLLRSNVLSLGQFEDVLFSVNDAQCPILTQEHKETRKKNVRLLTE